MTTQITAFAGILAVSAMLATSPLPAQLKTQVVPTGQNFDKQTGGIAGRTGFDGSVASRRVTLYSNAALGIRHGALLREIAFRPAHTMKSKATRTLRVSLGYPLAGVTPNRMWNDYAKVTGGLNKLQQVANVKLSLPAFDATGGGTTFSIRIPVAPFAYDARRGGLVVSVDSNAVPSTPFTAAYAVDSYVRPSDASGAASESLGSFCRHRAGGMVGSLVASDLKTWVPGSSGQLYLSRFVGPQAFVMLGTRRDKAFPIDLSKSGMPGCSLWTAPHVIVRTRPLLPHSRRGFTGYDSIDLPNSAALSGKRLRAQALAIDAKANALGVTLSNGLDITLGTPAKRKFLARTIFETSLNRVQVMPSHESAAILRLSYF